MKTPDIHVGDVVVENTVPLSQRWKRSSLAATSLAVLGIFLAVKWYSRATSSVAPVPPEINLSQASSELRNLIEDARNDILESPHSAGLWGHLGMALLANEHDVEAVPCFQQAGLLAPEDFRWQYYLGLATASLDREIALSSFSNACRIRPGDPACHARLGELYIDMGNTKAAGEHLQESIRNSETPDPRPMQALARVRLTEGRINDARQLAEKAFELAPDSRMVVEVLARVLNLQGETAAAQSLLHRLHQLPDQPLLWMDSYAEQALRLRRDRNHTLDVAMTLAAQGQIDQAIQLLTRQLNTNTAEPTTILRLAELYRRSERFDNAIDILIRGEKLFHQNSEFEFQLGVVRFLRGEYEESARSLERALALKPDHSLAAYNLGQCYRQLGNDDAAMKAFETTIRISPDHEYARENLANLLMKHGKPDEARYQLEQINRPFPAQDKIDMYQQHDQSEESCQ